MEKLILLFEEYVMKAVTMTETIINMDVDPSALEEFTANRERLFSIMDQMSREIDWNSASTEMKNELNRKIDYIKKLDEKLLVKLQEHQLEVRQEIERTYKQKENIKGYNLSDVK